ncbi:hypothetical protein F1528_04040 [Yersinia pestis]|nr:hypothetical protein F1528_04040 [Yersinia pestis]
MKTFTLFFLQHSHFTPAFRSILIAFFETILMFFILCYIVNQPPFYFFVLIIRFRAFERHCTIHKLCAFSSTKAVNLVMIPFRHNNQ